MYHKYQIFYPKAINTSLQNIKRQKRKEELDAANRIDLYKEDKSKDAGNNGFPIRSKKSGQQFFINMLFKYEKQFRNNKK